MDQQSEDPVALAAKLPLSERTTHKHWKVREAAYRELADKFNVAAEDAKIYSDFLPSLGKIVRDANAPAQLAGFEAIAKYADTAPTPLVRRVTSDVVKGIVEKGLSGRPANKAKAIEAFLMFIGADTGDIAVEAIVSAAFKHKTPKVVAAGVDCLTKAVDMYGTGPVPVKPISSKLGPLLSHSQESVRNAAKTLVVMLNRWIGTAIKVVLKDAKDVIVKEMETAFEENAKAGKPKPKKLTRAMEQRARRTGNEGGQSDEDDGFGERAAEEEEVDLAEEINLLEKLSKVKIEIEEGVMKDWYTAVDSKKWSARKNALDTAVQIIGDSRLTPASHQEIVTRLRRILAKDSNVNVVASAAKLVQALAGGLKKTFPATAAKALTIDLFGRLKEKNRIVVVAVSSALDALHQRKCIKVVELLDEVSSAAKHKVPKARCELLLWLGRCLQNGIPGVDLKGAPLKCFGTLFVKATDDSAPEVRDAGLAGLAALQKVVGERNIAQYLEKLDKKRKDKVIAIVAKMPEPVRVTMSKPSKAPTGNTMSQAAKKRAAATSDPPLHRASVSSPGQRKVVPKKKSAPDDSDDEGEVGHSPSDALAAAVEKFEGFEAENWSVKSFKTRAAAVGIITASLREKESFTDEDVSIVLGLLQCEPGLSDSNFIAVKPKLELFGMVAVKCASPPPRKTLRPLLICAAEKLGDIKSAKMAAEILMTFVEATSPRYFLDILVQCAKETKNSRALIGMLKFSASLVEDFGMPAVPESAIASLAADTLGNPAPAAKASAATLACKAANRLGVDTFRGLLMQHGAPSEGLELFDMEMPKYTRDPEPPTRKKRFASPVPTETSGLATPAPDVTKRETSNSQTAELAPEEHVSRGMEVVTDQKETLEAAERVSVAHEFASGARIFVDLKNSNWKKRQEALEYILSVLDKARDCIKPNVGTEIIAALRTRLSDSNRNLAALAYNVVSRLVLAMGPGGVIHLKILGPVVLGQGCIDIKKTVRESAMKCMYGWFDIFGLAPLIPFSHLPLASLNSAVRKEFLEWLIPRLQGEVGSFDASQEDLAILVDPCLVCLRDRTAEVRRLADLALEQVIRSVGISAVEGKVTSLTKSARLQMAPILDKYRGGQPGNETSEVGQHNKTSNIPTPRSSRQRPQSVALPRTPLHRRALATGEGDSTPTGGGRRPRPASVRVTPVSSSVRTEGTPVRDASPVLKPNNGRDTRARRFVNKRLYFAERLPDSGVSGDVPPLVGEDVQDLAGDLSECCSTELYAKLMAPANRFRMHVEAIELVMTQLEDNPDALVSVADVLLRWAACRVEDSKTPPTVLVKLASFVSNMCEVLISSGVKLGDYEASAILPPIIDKCGSNREAVREAMRGALLSVSDIVDDEVLLSLFTACLRQPVSARSHSEISSEICRLIDKRCTAGAGIPPGVLPTIGRIAGGEDDGAGRAAAACLERAHEHFGDDLWGLVGDLTNEEAAFLDDRLTSVINGMRQEVSSQRGDSEVLSEEEGLSEVLVGPEDIRNEDFRLSVAPAPPTSVLTSISDSLNMTTPVKTRREGPRESVSKTPSYPHSTANGDDSAQTDKASDILTRLKDQDRDSQLSGLASIFEDLKTDGELLQSPKGAELLLQLVRCFSNTLQRLETGSTLEDDPAVLKSFLKGVIRFAREPHLLRQLDQASVEHLLADALDAMIPQTVHGVDDWDQVRRGVNLMIVKVLESCDQNLLFTAMINLLLFNIRAMQRSAEDKTPALAKSSICIKSIAKVAKRGFQDCRVNALLRDIHLFLIANPVRRDGLSSAEDQTFAMRLLKTVVNAVIDEIGDAIRGRLDLIPQPEKSQLVHYVEMSLSSRFGNASHTDTQNASGLSATKDETFEVRSEGDVKLQEVLRQIDPQALTEDDLQRIDAVLIAHPEVDLSTNLVAFPLPVRDYVSSGLKGLQNVSNESHGTGTRSGNDIQSHSFEENNTLSDMSSQPNSISGTAGQVYLKRLHEIQLRYGLQVGSRPPHDKASELGTGEKENGANEKSTTGEDAKGKASSLRERMARIRELQAASKH